ncbi:LuxR C-terminal-related transcriptional regulator [Mangrovibacter plantisponsor]|uniref:DNA-binding NarL/FixJ family response regulator n=1 Tax=Mangrovibacter plantisponsor TaxID=451513 RepID=A0A317PXX2_9ENTR|nr:LuxR C-terminal-related transcriptional regulator [Mangrovibacter plantisponsor]PWW07083.1 DNA-binding NarL/FixJ family response regulator [Mangrovibacter plantisponsor]
MEQNKKNINIALLYKFNVFNEFLYDYIQKSHPEASINIMTFKNHNILLKIMEVDHIDVIFTDLSSWFSMMNHLQASQLATDKYRLDQSSKIVLMLQDAELHVIDKIKKLNVDIIISMTDDSYELKQALEHVFNPLKHSKYISESILELTKNTDNTQQKEKLSKNEWEVIKLFSEGYSLVEIAEQRSRAISTIATQKTSAMKKLNLKNNSELMKYVYINSII